MNITSPFYKYTRHTNLCFPSGLHHYCEIIAVSEGEINILINRTKITLTEGTGLFVPGYISHGFETEKKSTCHIWEFDAALIPEDINRAVSTFTFPADSILYLDRINNQKNLLICKGIIYIIASYICSETVKVHNLEINDICNKAALFIAENYDKNITLKDAAAFCNVSYAYLSKCFQKHVGVSFTQCLNNSRINKCMHLLTDSSIPITDVALSAGFNTLRNFNRVFLEQMGCTPLEYRNTGKKK